MIQQYFPYASSGQYTAAFIHIRYMNGQQPKQPGGGGGA